MALSVVCESNYRHTTKFRLYLPLLVGKRGKSGSPKVDLANSPVRLCSGQCRPTLNQVNQAGRQNFGLPGTEVQLNELDHSCMSLQITVKVTWQEEIFFLTEFRRLRLGMSPHPLSQDIAKVLGILAKFYERRCHAAAGLRLMTEHAPRPTWNRRVPTRLACQTHAGWRKGQGSRVRAYSLSE